jgi:hypothetical protein
MAPVKDTYPSYPRTYANSMSTPASSNAFAALSLGRSANAIELLVPPAPPIQSAPDLKARCFDFLSDLLLQHCLLYSSAELIAAFGHIPSSSYNASLEASGCCASVRSAFFRLENLVALGFRDLHGAPISADVTADTSIRPAGISYFSFRSTVTPSTVDPCLSLPSFSLDFWLALPQTVRVPSSSPVLDEVAKRLSFATPTAAGLSPPVATIALTVDALNDLDAATFAALGTKTSTDLLSDYSPACYPLFFA